MLKNCGARLPNLLRGTLLRKDVATTCIAFNLSEVKVNYLANFMRHSNNIHKDIYRQPLAQTDIVEVAKLLEMAQGINTDNDNNLDLSEKEQQKSKNEHHKSNSMTPSSIERNVLEEESNRDGKIYTILL